jgi:hypothetical protein
MREFWHGTGVSHVRVTDSPACRQKIASRLMAVGCPADLSGQQWTQAGDFAAIVGRQVS